MCGDEGKSSGPEAIGEWLLTHFVVSPSGLRYLVGRSRGVFGSDIVGNRVEAPVSQDVLEVTAQGCFVDMYEKLGDNDLAPCSVSPLSVAKLRQQV